MEGPAAKQWECRLCRRHSTILHSERPPIIDRFAKLVNPTTALSKSVAPSWSLSLSLRMQQSESIRVIGCACRVGKQERDANLARAAAQLSAPSVLSPKMSCCGYLERLSSEE